MAKAVSKKAEAPQAPQLLDTKSDYNNYSNLSYFISQYKRAVEIINECKTFYSNFLRNKLLTKSDIVHTPGINLLDMRFDIKEFAENANRLYQYYTYKVLQKEFSENLTKYRLVNRYREVYDRVGCTLCTVPDGYTIEAYNGGIPMGKDYFEYLIDSFCSGRWNVDDRKEKEHYEWRDRFFDKVLASSSDDNDEYISGFTKTGKNTAKIHLGNNKYVNVKTVDLERYRHEWKVKKGENVWKTTGNYDTFVLFGPEELKMVEILRKFNKKHLKVKKDILLNPEKYVDLWKEFIAIDPKYATDDIEKYGVVKKNGKYIVQEPGEFIVHHQGLDSKKVHRFMFAPVDYTYGETGWYTTKGKKRGDTYDEDSGLTYFKESDTDQYYIGDYSIDGVKFLNKEWLQAKFNDKKVRGFAKQYGSKRGDEFFINQRKLQLQIEKIHPETVDAIKKNADLLLRDDWYYVLIDNTPYPFADELSKAKINYNEDENILECSYKYTTRRKKAPWPGWMPWIVTTHYYDLEFDCKTNEPLSYDYTYDQVEEKCD